MSTHHTYQKRPRKPLMLSDIQMRQRVIVWFRVAQLAIVVATPCAFYLSHLSGNQAVWHWFTGLFFLAFMRYGEWETQAEIDEYYQKH